MSAHRVVLFVPQHQDGGTGEFFRQRAVAEALTASGAKFYGASWCPHCMDQKKMFGAAGRFLPYVECAPNGPRAPQATECVAEQIKGYPTWVINGNRYSAC